MCRAFIQIKSIRFIFQGERGKRASYKNISCFPVHIRQLCFVRKYVGYGFHLDPELTMALPYIICNLFFCLARNQSNCFETEKQCAVIIEVKL